MNSRQRQVREQSTSVPFGEPKSNRDARRMFNYNQRKWEQQPHPQWSDQVEIEEKFKKAEFKPRSSNYQKRSAARAQNWRGTNSATIQAPRLETNEFRSTTETERQSGLMYDPGPIVGSTPVDQFIGLNSDFSTFPVLCERVYRDMQALDERLPRKLPFPIFLHHCTVGLTANIIQIDQHENKRGPILSSGDVRVYLEQMMFPVPIQDYFSCLGPTSTLLGNAVSMNIPDITVPKSTGEGIADTFGPVTAANHNLYECYVSPRVTRRRIEAQLARDVDWTPLPAALMPGLVATPNFLGYGGIDNLNPEAQSLVGTIRFPSDDEDSVEGRLQFSPQVAGICGHVFRQLSQKYKFSEGLPERKRVPGFVCFLDTTIPTPSTQRLGDRSASLWCQGAFGSTSGNMQYYYGLHRRRTAVAPGYCCLRDGEPPDGWAETMN